MKATIALLVVIFIYTSCTKDLNQKMIPAATGAKIAIDSSLPYQKEIYNTVDNNIGGYLEALPVHYNNSVNALKKYPLLVTLHGLLELGNGTTDLHILKKLFIPKMLSFQTFPASFTVNGVSYSFIIVSPQFKVKPTAGNVNDMISYAIKKYRVDQHRIYVTGLSMGGAAVWDVAGNAVYGKRLSAVVPICGDRIPTDSAAKTIAVNKIAVWAFHNTYDTTVPSSYTVDWVNKINSYAPVIPARITLFPSKSHDAWTKASSIAYKENNMNMYEWMLQYHK